MDDLRIGGTRAASVLGVGFQSRYEVFCEMTGKVERKDISDLEYIEAGNFIEPAAKAWFAHRTKFKLLGCPGLLAHPKYPWAAGTPDDIGEMPDGTRFILDAKNCNVAKRKDWATNLTLDEDGQMPLGYNVQVQWYMAITGIEVAFFAAIVGGNKLETPSVKRDDKFIAWALEENERFLVENVQKDIPPPVTAEDLGVLKRLYPQDTGRTITAGPKDNASIALLEMIDFKRQIKALELQRDACEAVIKSVMQDATTLITPNATATWKTQIAQHQARPAKTVESRVLRTKESE